MFQQLQQVITGISYSVDDSALTASTVHSPGFGPHRSRLDTVPDGEEGGCWMAQFNDADQYIQVTRVERG